MGKVRLRREAQRLVDEQVLTIFSKWVESVDAARGEPVNVFLGSECVATGFYEGIGAVGLRILGWECGLDPGEIIASRLEEALKIRSMLPLRSDAYRLVNAEGDRLPGLIVDVYRDIAVVQSSSMGMDSMMGLIAGILGDLLDVRLVYARHDQRSRREAGLPVYRGVLWGSGPPTTRVREGDAVMRVDVGRGQKTGLFLDQRDNRLTLASLIAGGERVLDLYSYTGGFAIQALLAGASHAVLVEESEWAAGEAKHNLRLNGLEGRSRVIRGRVEEYLSYLKESFDVVIVDPPALIPSALHKEKGLRAYRALYRAAARALRPGGLLAASSCSYFLGMDEFIGLIGDGLKAAGLEARILKIAGASMDHVSRPVDRHLRYLKMVFVRVTGA